MKLTKDSFQLLLNQPNTMSNVAAYEVPRGEVLSLIPGNAITLYFTTMQVEALADDPGRTDINIVANAPIANNPDLTDKICIAYWTPTGQPRERAEVLDIDFTANEFEIEVTEDEGTLEIYYMFQDGSAEIIAIAPGVGVKEQPVFNDNVINIQTVNQYLDSAKPRVNTKLLLPQNFRLNLRLNSDVMIDWTESNAVFNMQARKTTMKKLRQMAASDGVKTDKDLYNWIVSSWL